jgi:hypothetical protein
VTDGLVVAADCPLSFFLPQLPRLSAFAAVTAKKSPFRAAFAET